MKPESEAPVQFVRVVGSQRHGDDLELGMRHDGLDESRAVAPSAKRLQDEYILEVRKCRAIGYHAREGDLRIRDKAAEAQGMRNRPLE